MPEKFDPYHKWLGIPPKDQPPNHYRLLGIELFESDADVIATAVDQRMAHVKTFATGAYSTESQQILNELATAKICLLNPEKKAKYDGAVAAREEASASSNGPAAIGQSALGMGICPFARAGFRIFSSAREAGGKTAEGELRFRGNYGRLRHFGVAPCVGICLKQEQQGNRRRRSVESEKDYPGRAEGPAEDRAKGRPAAEG